MLIPLFCHLIVVFSFIYYLMFIFLLIDCPIDDGKEGILFTRIKVINSRNKTKHHKQEMSRVATSDVAIFTLMCVWNRAHLTNMVRSQFSQSPLFTSLQRKHVSRCMFGDISNCLANLDTKFWSVRMLQLP